MLFQIHHPQSQSDFPDLDLPDESSGKSLDPPAVGPSLNPMYKTPK